MIRYRQNRQEVQSGLLFSQQVIRRDTGRSSNRGRRDRNPVRVNFNDGVGSRQGPVTQPKDQWRPRALAQQLGQARHALRNWLWSLPLDWHWNPRKRTCPTGEGAEPDVRNGSSHPEPGKEKRPAAPWGVPGQCLRDLHASRAAQSPQCCQEPGGPASGGLPKRSQERRQPQP
ncbi:hypothetical protein SRHO_G00230910 [Serrasalmus rhombeus]